MKNKSDLLNRRVAKVLPSKDDLAILISQRKIRLYQGFDPTGARLHLGHTIGLRKLMEFADLGHQVIFLFGTGTVLVGDPSERDSGRKLIAQEEINQNIKNWKTQVSPLVDFEKVTIKQNADWLLKLNLKDIVNIASNISAVQLFKRESFTRRIKQGNTVWYHETMYPLLQGYDSVAMDVDLEIGGTDQEFNMLVGRELQRKMNKHEKFVLTTPMIDGTDGNQMSKTSGNCVWLDDNPEDMYGKLMSIGDNQIKTYFQNLTNIPLKEIDNLPNTPLDNKKQLALNIATQFHGSGKAQTAAKNFADTIQGGKTPKNIPSYKLTTPTPVIQILEKSKLVQSRGEAKRLISQNAVTFNNKKVTSTTLKISSSGILKAGKRRWLKIT